MKARTLRPVSGCGSYLLGRVHLQRCAACKEEAADGKRHREDVHRTRMALVIPLLDIEDDGGPGLGAVVLCGEHLEDALVRLTNAERKEA